ncbi:MAG: primosomal protein N' [Bacteroidota bacterium]
MQLEFNSVSTETAQPETRFADVILPLPLPALFTYRVPADMNAEVQVGSRVIVQFGKKKVMTAVIAGLHTVPPKEYQAKYILELLDTEPTVTPIQLRLFGWMAEYYLCAVGDVMNAALPSGLKLSSESRIQFNPDFDIDLYYDTLEPDEKKLIDALQQADSLLYDEAADTAGVKNIYKLLKQLIGKRAIILFEQVKEKYKPKVIKKVRLYDEFFSSEARLNQLFTQLERSPKQVAMLMTYLQKVPVFNNPDLNAKGLEKNTILGEEKANRAVLSALVTKRVFEEFTEQISRFEDIAADENAEIILSEPQERVRRNITEIFESKDVALLHGITGSGKTEIYIQLIQQVLDGGSQVLFLLPEIALTTQIVSRLRKVFGSKMGVYHSRFSDNERVEVYRGVRNGTYNFVVGVRSAIFLPFDNLGLIIVDEEHETSYKQADPAPRYNARDMAVVLNSFHQGKLLLGSATPSIETYFHASSGRWGLAELSSRFGNAPLPDIKLVDLKAERNAKTMKNNFSSTLLDALEQNARDNKQSILFQNRRGYSPYMNCLDCGWIPKCINCDVSLTYHMAAHELRCHYCGHYEAPPSNCRACGRTRLKTVGFGTEKIEEELQLLMPDLRIQRMDLDSTRKKHSFQDIISDFETGKTDVLVGTQMVSKGLDFDNVTLVGIFDVDRMIHFPDFRSHERTFQLLTQVSGRAGRRKSQGRVLIQTGNIEHNLLKKVLNHDYAGLYEEEIAERKKFYYPPFSRLIRLSIKHEDEISCHSGANKLADKLKAQLTVRSVLGPETPLISRIRNLHLQEIMIKIDRESGGLKGAKQIIVSAIAALTAEKEFRALQVIPDVDPL